MSRIFLIGIALLSGLDNICEGGKKTAVGKLSSTQKQVEAIYRRVAPCLELTPTLNNQLLSYNGDLESHWKEILLVTEQYRHLPPHNGSYYAGPWIENLFIDNFIKRPFSYFNGIIPLFVQWSDYHLHYKRIINPETGIKYTEEEIFRNVSSVLRSNVMYMVVSQANYGIEFLMEKHPNVLIFSAGGVGNVPIPLIKGELAYKSPEALTSIFPKYNVGFYGSVDHGHREKMLGKLKRLLDSGMVTYKMGPSKAWIEDMSYTLYNLAPMGMGRASFRLAEIVQMGRIPVYIFEDFPWLPYEGTGFGPADLGYLVKSDDMPSLMAVVRSATNSSIADKMKRVKEARSLYTYEGLLNQIEKWFRDPFGPRGGLLRCKRDGGGGRSQKEKNDLHVEALSALG